MRLNKIKSILKIKINIKCTLTFQSVTRFPDNTLATGQGLVQHILYVTEQIFDANKTKQTGAKGHIRLVLSLYRVQGRIIGDLTQAPGV